jgi:hypothetical protein
MKSIPNAHSIIRNVKILRAENACQFWWGERPREPKANSFTARQEPRPTNFSKKDCPVSGKTGIYR